MDLKEVKNQLPHGSIRKIAKAVNVSESTVSKFLSGEIKSNKESDILQEAANLLIAYKEQKRSATDAIKKAISFV